MIFPGVSWYMNLSTLVVGLFVVLKVKLTQQCFFCYLVSRPYAGLLDSVCDVCVFAFVFVCHFWCTLTVYMPVWDEYVVWLSYVYVLLVFVRFMSPQFLYCLPHTFTILSYFFLAHIQLIFFIGLSEMDSHSRLVRIGGSKPQLTQENN